MWKTVKLKDVCTIKTGRKDVNEGNDLGQYPFFTCAKEHTFSDGYSFDCEAILIAGNGAVGQTTYYKGKFEAYQRTYVLSDFNNIEPKLLLFIMQGRLMSYLSSMVLGNTIPYIKKGMLQDFEFLLPPLAEQQRIVAKLDAAFAEIDTAIDSANAQINNIDMLRKRILNGWIEKNASPEDYCTVQDCIDKEWIKQPFDGNHGEIHPKASDYTATGVPFIMARDLSNGEVNLTECKFISHEQAASLRVGFAKNNDVLFTHKGTIGEVALLECQADFVMLTPQVTAYRVIDESRIDRLFLYYLFKSVFFQSQIQQIAGIGTTRAYIGITRQKQLSLCLPSIELQQQAVSVLKNSEPYVSTIGFANKNKLEQLLKLKSSILAQELQSEAA